MCPGLGGLSFALIIEAKACSLTLRHRASEVCLQHRIITIITTITKLGASPVRLKGKGSGQMKVARSLPQYCSQEQSSLHNTIICLVLRTIS